MPFYLVTQTSLIEADDENAAARKAIDQVRSGKKVTVTVKSDEINVSHIVVDEKPIGVTRVHVTEPQQDGKDKTDPAEPPAIAETDKKAALKRILKDALTLVRWRH